MWRYRERVEPESANPYATLVDESAAFLRGDLVGQWLLEGRAVPGWAWLSLLAHGSVPQIKALRLHPDGGDTPDAGWRAALAFLSNLLCALESTEGPPIEEVQRRVLVPLELRSHRSPVLTPESLIQQVLAALQRAGIS